MAVIKEVPLKWVGTLQVEDMGHFLYQTVINIAGYETTITKFIGSTAKDDNGEILAGMLCMKHEKQEDVFVVPFGMRIEDPHGQVIDKIPLEDHAADYLFTASGFSISDEELEYFKNKNEDNSEKPVYTYFSKFDYKEDSDNEQ